MSPFGRTWLWAAVSGAACVGVWILVRLFLITELFGRATPNAEEVIAALLSGLIVGSAVCEGYKSWLNRRDHAAALADLSSEMGFRFSVPTSRAELGTLADWPLLDRYTTFLSRMTGTVVQGHPVELLDGSRWVERRNENGTTRFEWRHTLVVFPEMTALPAFSLNPVGLADRYLHTFTGTKGVTFVHGIGTNEQDLQKHFDAQYFVWPGDKPYFASLDAPIATQTAELGAVFTADVIRFFADHPGWFVEVNAGKLAMLREDRIVVPAERMALLTEAVKVFRILTQGRREQATALRINPEKPLDLKHAANRMILLFLGGGAGLWIGFFLSIAVLMPLVGLFPDPPTWFPLLVLFVLVPGFMFTGAYVGFRVVRRLIRDLK